MSNKDTKSSAELARGKSRRPKVAKYRPQLTKPEIDLIINCLSAALVSGYNNPDLPAVIKKFKLLAHKIDLDAIAAGYTVAAPAKQKEPLAKDTQGAKLSEEELAALSETYSGTSLNVDNTVITLTEEYVWEKYQALGGSPEALAELSEEEQALVSMYKANSRMELTEEDNKRISGYMIAQLSGE